MTSTAPPRSLTERLDDARVTYTLISHRRTHSAAAEARALDVDPSTVVKTIVLTTADGFVRAVIPASRRLDLEKTEEVLLGQNVRLATEDVLTGAYPDFELGAVPPLFPGSDRVLVDWRVCGNDHVLLDAGTHDQSIRIRTADLLELADACLVDICEEGPPS